MHLRKLPYAGTSRPGPIPLRRPSSAPPRPGSVAGIAVTVVAACVALMGLGAPSAAVPTVAVGTGLGAVEIVRRLHAAFRTALRTTAEPE